MELDKIETLLAKFHNGDSTLEEEELLRKFFLENDDVPAHLLPDKEYFLMMDNTMIENVPFDNFLDNLEEIIDKEAKTIVPIHYPYIKWVSGIAAAILLVISTYLIFNNNPTYQQFEITDEQLAYEETQKALLLISEKLNTGTRQLNNLQSIDKPIESLNNLNKINKGLNNLNALQHLEKENIKN